jgi:hypothetical protein
LWITAKSCGYENRQKTNIVVLRVTNNGSFGADLGPFDTRYGMGLGSHYAVIPEGRRPEDFAV